MAVLWVACGMIMQGGEAIGVPGGAAPRHSYRIAVKMEASHFCRCVSAALLKLHSLNTGFERYMTFVNMWSHR